jgi:hypothetical protein
LALTVEIGDWTRFTGASIVADLGLISCEYSNVVFCTMLKVRIRAFGMCLCPWD